MNRRDFLKQGLTASAGLALGGGAEFAPGANANDAKWRTFEVTTRIDIADPVGAVRAWVPVPLMTNTDYFKREPDSWTGNYKTVRAAQTDKVGTGLVFAEWPAGEKSPTVEVKSRFMTQDRWVDLSQKPNPAIKENKAVLDYFRKPSKYIRTDGIVATTSKGIVMGYKTDVDKARAIYEWIVDNTFRDPKVKGCGVGDIRAMLETGNLGGKCADLNALFVGLARAAGLPARDVYWVRVADSAEFKCLGKSGDITKAQHCRAEFYTASLGWVPVDPADVRKVVLEERGGIPLDDPTTRKARAKLFGQWEMNWLAYNYAHDVKLVNSKDEPVAFLMYPQAETGEGRKDSLDPDAFKYKITSRELGA